MESTDSPPVCFKLATLEAVQSPTGQTFIFLLYLGTSVISVISNLLVILVQLLGSRESSRNVRRYLNNLALSDITLALMSMPFTYSNTVLGHWPYPKWLCPAAQYAQLLSVFITSMTLSLIGIERYILTLHPLSAASHWFKSHTFPLLTFFWLCGALYAYFPTVHTYVNQFEFNGTVYQQCNYYNDQSDLSMQLYIGINFFITFLLPLLIIIFSYSAIINKLNDSETFIALSGRVETKVCLQIHKSGTIQTQSLNRLLSAEIRTKTIQIMFTVILMYIICWFPVKLFQFLANYQILKYCTEAEFNFWIYTYIACHWLAMANCMVNPIIYSFMSKSFRNDLKKIIQNYCIIRFDLTPF